MKGNEELQKSLQEQYRNEYRQVIGCEKEDPVNVIEYCSWLERKVAGMESRKRKIHRDDLVILAGKIWRVDWFEGSTLGVSNNAGEHKEIGEGCVRLLSEHFRERTIEEILP